jgi:hypothetical protein
MTGPVGGDSPLTSYEASVAACRQAVADATAANDVQQAAARVWFIAGLPEDPQAHPPAPANAPNL